MKITKKVGGVILRYLSAIFDIKKKPTEVGFSEMFL